MKVHQDKKQETSYDKNSEVDITQGKAIFNQEPLLYRFVITLMMIGARVAVVWILAYHAGPWVAGGASLGEHLLRRLVSGSSP